MFREAYAIAREFTKPVVLSRLTVAGKCESGIGSYVVINKDGWIVTASHILEDLERMTTEEQGAQAHEAKVAAITTDASLPQKEKSKRLAQLGKLRAEHTRRCSAWWGKDGMQIVDVEGITVADIAVARLEPFDPTEIKTYPVFKDPGKDFEPGVSLCKLGFPFHRITPTWDKDANAFRLPAEAFPMPLFPMEGIFTRIQEVVVTPNPPPFPILFVETSTPGLRGQSGGPTFDMKGTIWAIQSKTMHLPLGFDPPVPGGKGGQKEHQFLNTGLGVHPATMFGLFKKKGIAFQVSAY